MRTTSLRRQLLFSHLALVGLMALVMLGAVLNFFRLGHSIDRILKDNYKSVIAAQDMKETLERQDSAATFFLAGQTHKARTQYEANWPRFEQALDIEAHNITERGEQELSEAIKQQFAAYRQATEALLYANPPMTTEQARAYYFSTLEPEFQRLKQSAQDVLALNQEAIVRADARAKVAADRASWMGVGITFGALLLAVVFARQAINASLTPLLAL
ncbi:MAG: MCP four helix bundle domain-containing protein, partial [Abitibacteriaceae bacterium]|nr:MCP four helix bundle domain-containing protein [Abditibacteriaceae bacterium]